MRIVLSSPFSQLCFGVRDTIEAIRIEAIQADLATLEHLAALRRQQFFSLSAQRNLHVFYSWFVFSAHTLGAKKSTHR